MLRSMISRGWPPSLIAAFSAGRPNESKPIGRSTLVAVAAAEVREDVPDRVDEHVAHVQRVPRGTGASRARRTSARRRRASSGFRPRRRRPRPRPAATSLDSCRVVCVHFRPPETKKPLVRGRGKLSRRRAAPLPALVKKPLHAPHFTGGAPDGAGAHQFQPPRSAIRLGTSSARTRVASIATATAIPTPSSLTIRSPEVANAPTATQKRSAAPRSRPVRSLEPERDGLAVREPRVVGLLEPGEEEDPVVGREAERDREQQHGLSQLERSLAAVVEEPLEAAVLEDEDEMPNLRRGRARSLQQRLRRQDERAGDEEQEEKVVTATGRARRQWSGRSRPCRDTTRSCR